MQVDDCTLRTHIWPPMSIDTVPPAFVVKLGRKTTRRPVPVDQPEAAPAATDTAAGAKEADREISAAHAAAAVAAEEEQQQEQKHQQQQQQQQEQEHKQQQEQQREEEHCDQEQQVSWAEWSSLQEAQQQRYVQAGLYYLDAQCIPPYQHQQ